MLSWRAAVGLVALVAVLVATIMPVLPAQEAAPSPAPAATGSAPRRVMDGILQGVVSLEGKEIPLPAGEWHLAGRAVSTVDQTSPQRTVVSLALVRLRGMAVDAAVLVQTNRLDSEAAWGKASACDRTDLYFASVRYASDHDSSCAYAAYVDPAIRLDAVDPAWKQAVLLGAGVGWRFPAQWVEAAYRITDPRDALQVRYLFDSADQAGGMLSGAAVASLVRWTQANWYAVGSGFRNRLGAESTGIPNWQREGGGSRDARQLAPINSETSQFQHLGVKMVTYRIFGTITDLTVNYLWLGSLPSATGLAVLGAVASSSLYFVHELVWSRFEKPQVLVGDLPGVGAEGPGPARS